MDVSPLETPHPLFAFVSPVGAGVGQETRGTPYPAQSDDLTMQVPHIKSNISNILYIYIYIYIQYIYIYILGFLVFV
jgi:hypothetical protein